MVYLKKVFNINKVLFFLIVLLFLNNVLFSLIDDRGLNYHEVHYLSQTNFSDKESSFLNLVNNISFNYPFTLPLMYYLLKEIFGSSHKIGLIVNQMFLLVLLYAVYKIGKNIHDKFTGILAAFITLTIPEIINFSRQITFTFPLICIVALALSFIIKKINDIKPKDTILFGIFLGIASLIKQEFFSFFIGPVIILLYQLGKNKRIKCLVFLILGLITAFCLSMLWWWRFGLHNIVQIVGAVLSPPSLFSAYNYPSVIQIVKYAFVHLFLISLGPFYFVLFLISCVYLLITCKSKYVCLFLLSWIIIPLFIWIRIPVDLYPFYPSLPGIAILCAYFISKINPKFRIPLKSVFLFLIIIYGLSIAHFKIVETPEEIHSYLDSHSYKMQNNRLQNLICLLSVKCLKPEVIFPKIVNFDTHFPKEKRDLTDNLRCIFSFKCPKPYEIVYKDTLIGTKYYKIDYFAAIKSRLMPVNEIFDRIKEKGYGGDVVVIEDQKIAYYRGSIFEFYKNINEAYSKFRILTAGCLTSVNPFFIPVSELKDYDFDYLIFYKNGACSTSSIRIAEDKNLTKIGEFGRGDEFLIEVYGKQ